MKTLDNFPYSHVLVLGLAKSGTAAAKLLLQSGKRVRVNDKNANENDDAVNELKSMGAEVITGSHPLCVLDSIEIVVKNPGIPYDNPILVEAKKRDISIITEIEIAGNLVESSIIGITGSNGKTTTTTLTTEMLVKSNQSAKIAGNIGYVATDVAKSLGKEEKMVLELSSFQLMGVKTFKPKIAVLLNIFEAHLDYHKTFENYKEAKCNVFANQSEDDFLIYNADDPVVSEAVLSAKSMKIPFSLKKRLNEGAWVDKTSIYFKSEKIIDKSDIVLVGAHNLENILAAISAAKLSGASNEGVREVLINFSSVKHRLQFVENIDGRLFYNDSKATNILASQKALSSFKQPTILLAGGLDRGNEFDDLIPYLNNVKGVILFGETKEKLKKTASDAGVEVILTVNDMNQAVKQAYSISERDDVILLSPACASWDQYRTFEERGDMFIQAVHTLM
ncbi:UDP-N-acetylmuramoylalanine--D-glutamate ligase [Virgibacillus subterraneus]|uniref:UDP-N-acetylmuramoylalanine--D-glutamate ligase n=1 Tax=Virgibacillus subterraneus TaxID=621109 RepID=A0A1H9HFS8_9BACI|nr:UDP-N-acetylmuramoyl-L-alanine--D-glutamate ligase [Virgibacillus subterraneus]SEQ61076.1 UDP-N-acetylmuramoylalanine--D-glutamate ligase [Virgibacillus subterraneus]